LEFAPSSTYYQKYAIFAPWNYTLKNMIPHFRIIAHLILLFLCFHLVCMGQPSNDTTFSNWQKKDGFPSNNIHAVVKDKLGFLWVATNDGLCRYDGPGVIKVYKQRQPENQDAASNTLQSDNIRALFCDSQGYLWIGTRFGGLTRFRPATNEWQTFRHNPDDENSLSYDEVLTIMEDSKQRIWVGTEDGLNLFNPSLSTFTHFKLNKIKGGSEASKAILTIFEDKKGWIWAGTWAGGLHLLLEDENGNFDAQQIRHFESTSNRASNNIWSFYQDNDGRYWVGTHGGGLLLMHLPEDATNRANHQNWQATFHEYQPDSPNAINLNSNAVQAILQDQFGTLWVGTTYGLYTIPQKSLPPIHSNTIHPLKFETFLPVQNDVTTIIGENIMNLYEDEQGLVWISTTNGLSQYNWYSNQFESHYFPENVADLSDTPNFFIDNKQNIWIGNGTNTVLKFQIEQEELVQVKENFANLILGKNVSTIHSPDGERLFTGTELGVTAIDLETLEAKKYPTPGWMRDIIKDLFIKNIFVDKQGFIWLGTKVGLLKIDPDTKKYLMYEPEAGNPNSMSDHSVNHILQDSQGAIWVATYNGLNRIKNPSEDDLVFERFFYNDEQPDKGLVDNAVMYLKEAREYLYIGTLSGMCRYNFSSRQFEGLNGAKYWIRSIEEGDDGNLWVSTNEGIFGFNPDEKSFRTFDKNDGLKNTTFRLGSSFKTPDNTIYFVSRNGFTRFSPNELASNTLAPPVYITEIEKTDRKGNTTKEIFNKKQIELNYKDYRLSVNFAALNYNRGDKNRYIYRLEGVEDQWSEGKLGVPIVYTNLQPQKYKLEVRAANNDGIWNNEGNFIEIVQHPPYWKTWWFRLLALVFIATCIFSIFVWYTNKIRKHNEELKAYNKILNEEVAIRKKTELQLQNYNDELKRSNKDLEQFAYIASHDLREPLRVIGNFSGLLARRYSKNLDSDAMEYIDFIEGSVKRMSDLIHSLLTFSIVGRKNSVYQSIDLQALIKAKLFDLSQIIKEKNVTVRVENLPEIIGEREQIGMVFSNLIHNAIKFNTQATPLVIVKEVAGDEAFWTFSVKDNGIGIEPEYQDKIFGIFKRLQRKYEGTGIGLSICQKIILRHQGEIWFESTPGKGTTFYFTIKKGLSNTADDAENEEVQLLEYD